MSRTHQAIRKAQQEVNSTQTTEGLPRQNLVDLAKELTKEFVAERRTVENIYGTGKPESSRSLTELEDFPNLTMSPDAKVVAHPECTYAVRMLADEVCSTEKMVDWCRKSPASSFIIVTESGMLHRLRREMPEKTFIPGPTDHCACADCRFMKMNTLEKLHAALRDLEPEIVLPEPLRARAELPIRRMLELSR